MRVTTVEATVAIALTVATAFTSEALVTLYARVASLAFQATCLVGHAIGAEGVVQDNVLTTIIATVATQPSTPGRGCSTHDRITAIHHGWIKSTHTQTHFPLVIVVALGAASVTGGGGAGGFGVAGLIDTASVCVNNAADITGDS